MKSSNRLKHGAKSYREFHGGDLLEDEEEKNFNSLASSREEAFLVERFAQAANVQTRKSWRRGKMRETSTKIFVPHKDSLRLFVKGGN